MLVRNGPMKKTNCLFLNQTKKINIEQIAQIHERTVGGIKSRQIEIDYKMFNDNIYIENIISNLKLNEFTIRTGIERTQKKYNGKIQKESPQQQMMIEIQPHQENTIEDEIQNIKNDIKELKSLMNQMIGMLNTIYDFEKS